MKSFDSIEKLENFLMKYMEKHNSMELYVYMRYGYTKKKWKMRDLVLKFAAGTAQMNFYGGTIGMKDRSIVKFFLL